MELKNSSSPVSIVFILIKKSIEGASFTIRIQFKKDNLLFLK